MQKPEKINFESLKANMRVFLDFPKVEESMLTQVEQTIGKILLTKAQNGGRPPVDVLTDYLNAGRDTADRLKIIVGFSGGSMEKLKRVYEAVYPGKSWGEIKNNAAVRRRVAAFLINPNAEETFIPNFIRDGFFLPPNWMASLQNESYLRAVTKNILQAKYAVISGNALEECIRETIGDGWDKEKGRVEIVDNKEVDIAVPSVTAPKVLIMSSYQLTSSSAQTSKANEQARMYAKVRDYNLLKKRREMPDVLFVNVVDGGGWLNRNRDLETLWRNCDYCFSHSTLGGLREVLAFYSPKEKK